MLKNTLYILPIILILSSCSNNAPDEKSLSFIDEEIAQLDTDEKLKAYWQDILDLDQKYRNEGILIAQQHGLKSVEYKENQQKVIESDRLNLAKTEKLLAKFGHPTRAGLGRKATEVPWLVVHHSATYEDRERNFRYLFDAYKAGDLRESAFSFYLNRMYEMKMGKRYEVGDVFKEADRVNGIIEELGLGGY